MSPLSESRCLELIESYGANVARWPEAEREAGRLAVAHPSARIAQALDEASTLDRFLSYVPLTKISPFLTRHVIALYERERSQPRWAPVAAAATLLLGVGLGWMGAAAEPVEAATIHYSDIPSFSAMDLPQGWWMEGF